MENGVHAVETDSGQSLETQQTEQGLPAAAMDLSNASHDRNHPHPLI